LERLGKSNTREMDSDSGDSASTDEEISYDTTYLPWTHAEDEWLWAEYAKGTHLDKLCRSLDRFADDVILRLTVDTAVDFEQIEGFGGPTHLALDAVQEKALRDRPLFRLRLRKREQETLNRIEKKLEMLLFRRPT